MSMETRVSLWVRTKRVPPPDPTIQYGGYTKEIPYWFMKPLELLSGSWLPLILDKRQFLRMSGVTTAWYIGVLALQGVFSDRHIRTKLIPRYNGWNYWHAGRYTDLNNFYAFETSIPDNYIEIRKVVGGTGTILAYMSYTLDVNVEYDAWLSISGATLEVTPDAGTTILSATDPDLASGRWGIASYFVDRYTDHFPISFGSQKSTLPKPTGYFLVPVIGRGTPEDSYRAKVPNGVTSYSAFIPTKNGKPIFPNCVVRTFDSESALLFPSEQKISRDEAIKFVLQDDRLMLCDLIEVKESDPKFDIILKDYMKHREGLGAIAEEGILRSYLTKYKGW